MRVMPSTGHYEPVSDYYLQDESQDLRGRTVTGPDGDLGTVKDMLVDPDIQKVAMIELSDGRRIPIKYVRLHGSQVRIVTENQR
ncbi:PRC-barrel domain-containing protein [Algimonas porphyrae]